MGQHFISYFRLYRHLGKLKETQFRKLCDRVSPLSLFSKAPVFGPRSKEGFCLQDSDIFGAGSVQTASCQGPRHVLLFCQVVENECNRSVYGSVVLFSSWKVRYQKRCASCGLLGALSAGEKFKYSWYCNYTYQPLGADITLEESWKSTFFIIPRKKKSRPILVICY